MWLSSKTPISLYKNKSDKAIRSQFANDEMVGYSITYNEMIYATSLKILYEEITNLQPTVVETEYWISKWDIEISSQDTQKP